MDNPGEIMRLCRLCLVKDQVNIPIFDEQGDIRQIFLKISSCLPVKVSKEDQLPKSICDGCSNKLDLLYEFRNSSVNAEKALLSWVSQAIKDVDETVGVATQPVAKPSETQVKEETLEECHAPLVHSNDSMDAQESAAFDENSAKEESDEPPPPKRARRTAAVKAQINIAPDSDDEDDDDLDIDAEPLTKIEDESDESDGDEKDDPSYPDVPGTSADDQPGPSGVGKDGVEAPYSYGEFHLKVEMEVSEQVLEPAYLTPSPRKQASPRKVKIKVESDEDEEYFPAGNKKKKGKMLKTPKKEKPEPPKQKKPKRKKQEHKLWTCRRCLQEFDTRKGLTEHSKMHHEETPDDHTFKYDEDQDLYYCNTCSAEYQTQEEVEQHISKIHEEFYSCEICNHESKKAYTFALHMKTHSTDDLMVCPLCNYSTPRRTCLQTHINRVHYHKFYYTCGTCGKGFNDSVIYKEHNNEHMGIKPFICVVCNKAFCYSRYMNIHQVRHHTVHIEGTLHKTQCSICLKVFSKVDTLLKHITTKHRNGEDKNEKRHLCDLCGKGFGTSDKLKIHYRIHTGEKPFHCRFCEKCFTKKDYLIMHERIHTGEKPYPCEYCGKCFNQACSLRIHVRGHTGERPYICQFCNGGYISRGSLNLHMKTCSGMRND